MAKLRYIMAGAAGLGLAIGANAQEAPAPVETAPITLADAGDLLTNASYNQIEPTNVSLSEPSGLPVIFRVGAGVDGMDNTLQLVQEHCPAEIDPEQGPIPGMITTKVGSKIDYANNPAAAASHALRLCTLETLDNNG